jgi:hypothetical protein
MKTIALKSVLIGLTVLMISPWVAVPVRAEEKKTTLFSVLERLLGSSEEGSSSAEVNHNQEPEENSQSRNEKNQETESNPISITLDRQKTAEGFSPEVEIKTPSWQRKIKANIKQKSTPDRLNIEGVIEGIGALFKIKQTDDRAFTIEGGMEGEKPFEIEAKIN